MLGLEVSEASTEEGGMVDEHTSSIVEQLTLRKLEYVRSLLKAINLPHSGPRPKVRERLVDAIDSNRIAVATLQTLLNELDAWGDQRVRIGRLSPSILAEFQSTDAIAHKATEAGMSHLLHGEVDLVPPLDLTPMKICYEEHTGRKKLRLVAAKTRQLQLPQPEIPDYVDQRFPGVVFKPFKVETQKVLAFAEISLDNGLTFISTTLLRQGQGYIAEFGEFFTVFRPLIPLNEAEVVALYNATCQIRQLPVNEVRIVARQARTSVGGKIHFRAHSAYADIRADPELDQTQAVLPNALGSHCNCFWEPVNGLEERVHTHVFAPEGEISLFGQVREASARYVLQKILGIN
jgi:hypothetical protein